MKIDILCHDGSPLGVTVKDIWGKGKRGIGVGGAELALLTMCEEWHKRGHEVVLYNNPLEPDASPFEQRPLSAFQKQEKRDVLITFRSPNPRAYNATGYQVWWSCDQYTRGDFRAFGMAMDKIVTISPFHADFFAARYGLNDDRVVNIDLPVRVGDYERVQVDREPYKVIFNSVPDRGLQYLARMWPRLKSNFPDMKLVITSDYRLWGAAPLNHHHLRQWSAHRDVQFLGAVPRERLIVEQLSADLHLYPCAYEELFCISLAENMIAGAYPIASTVGALSTTNMGVKVEGHPTEIGFDERFVAAVIERLSNRERLESDRVELMERAYRRFHPDRIVEQWNELVFKDL